MLSALIYVINIELRLSLLSQLIKFELLGSRGRARCNRVARQSENSAETRSPKTDKSSYNLSSHMLLRFDDGRLAFRIVPPWLTPRSAAQRVVGP